MNLYQLFIGARRVHGHSCGSGRLEERLAYRLFLLLRYGSGPVRELAHTSCLVLSCLRVATKDFRQATAAGVLLYFRYLLGLFCLFLNWFRCIHSLIGSLSRCSTILKLLPQAIISNDLIDLLDFVGFVHLSRSITHTQSRQLELLLDKHVILSLFLPDFCSTTGLGLVLLREDLRVYMQLSLDLIVLRR